MKNWWLLIGCLLLAISFAFAGPFVANKMEVAQWGGGPLIKIYAPVQAPKIFALRVVNNLYWLVPGIVLGLFSARPALRSGFQIGFAFAITTITISFIYVGFPRYTASHFLSPTLADDVLTSMQNIFLFMLSTSFGSALMHHRYAPNNSFKPKPLRGSA